MWFEMSLFVVNAIRGRCASFMILTATVSEICGGQTNVYILALAGYPASLGFPISIMHPFHAICTGSTS